MGLEFISNNSGARMQTYPPPDQPPTPLSEGDREEVNQHYETEDWSAGIEPNLPRGWQAGRWPFSPVRFIDGRDIGDTVAWIRDHAGHPVPFRLSTIGSTAMQLIDGDLRREYAFIEMVLSAVLEGFPAWEVESFARALQRENIRLLLASQPEKTLLYDFETMRKAAQNRSNDEMGTLEEAALAHANHLPTIVDGRLEPRQGGFLLDQSPVFGVIKTHNHTYLNPQGLQLMQDLAVGQRTPVFSIVRMSGKNGSPRRQSGVPVVSWYLRLAGDARSLPAWGVVRVEVSKSWFENVVQKDFSFVDQLSRTLYEYRCRSTGYGRMAISLHPIMRAEQSLGAIFPPGTALVHRFYRLTGL